MHPTWKRKRPVLQKAHCKPWDRKLRQPQLSATSWYAPSIRMCTARHVLGNGRMIFVQPQRRFTPWRRQKSYHYIHTEQTKIPFSLLLHMREGTSEVSHGVEKIEKKKKKIPTGGPEVLNPRANNIERTRISPFWICIKKCNKGEKTEKQRVCTNYQWKRTETTMAPRVADGCFSAI